MKTAEELIQDINSQDGPRENPCNIKPEEVNYILEHALLHAAETALTPCYPRWIHSPTCQIVSEAILKIILKMK